jgi:DNA-binding transcriptional MerR regulator
MLRHYDKIGLLVPEQVDDSSGYRYYNSGQLVRANQIVALKSMGFGLKEIESLQWTSISEEQIQAFLQKKLADRQKEMDTLKMQIRRIEEALHNVGKNEYGMSIVVKTIPAHKVVSIRDKIHHFAEEGRLWEKLNGECGRLGVKFSTLCSAIAIQHGIDHDAHEIDVEVQLTVETMMEDTQYLKFHEVPECEAASITIQGGYSKLGEINVYVAGWIEQNGYEIGGKVFSIYHRSPKNEADENNFITELCFPVRNRNKEAKMSPLL